MWSVRLHQRAGSNASLFAAHIGCVQAAEEGNADKVDKRRKRKKAEAQDAAFIEEDNDGDYQARIRLCLHLLCGRVRRQGEPPTFQECHCCDEPHTHACTAVYRCSGGCILSQDSGCMLGRQPPSALVAASCPKAVTAYHAGSAV